MSKTILLVGCGQIGFRHLQACLKIKSIKNIDILEKVKINKNISSLILSSEKKIRFINDTKILNKNYDLLIFSTTSAHTFKIFKKLSYNINFNKVLFEKITFSKIKHYDLALKILKLKNIKAWVDCSSRYQPFFNYLKRKFNSKQSLTMISEAENDYFISNFVHNHDIFNYIIKQDNTKIIALNIKSVFKSKRLGYHDLEGNSFIRSKNNSCFYTSNINTNSLFEQRFLISQSNKLVTALFKDYIIFVKFRYKKKVQNHKFKFKFQSVLSQKIITDIFSNKTKLTNFTNYSVIQKDILNNVYLNLKKNRKIKFT